METINFNGELKEVSLRSSTDISTMLSNGTVTGLFNGEIYNIDGVNSHVALVAVSGRNGADVKGSATIITIEQYEEILELHDPYNSIPFHLEIMGAIGFE